MSLRQSNHLQQNPGDPNPKVPGLSFVQRLPVEEASENWSAVHIPLTKAWVLAQDCGLEEGDLGSFSNLST